jgi:hypothetical protein
MRGVSAKVTSMSLKSTSASRDFFKIVSLNVNSLRHAWGKGLKSYVDTASPDIFCIQSTDVSSGSTTHFHLLAIMVTFIILQLNRVSLEPLFT